MSSSGRTMVSRTRERMLSLRRSRRGLRVIAPPLAVTSLVVEFRIFVVIQLSGEVVGPRTVGGTEPPPMPGANGALRTERAVADVALLEPRGLFGRPATHANPFERLGHPKYLPTSAVDVGARASYNPPPSHPGGVAQMVRA